jgi:hypothetical protein
VRLAGGTAEAVALALDRICIECPCHNVVLLGDQTFVFVRSPEGEVSTSISGSDDLSDGLPMASLKASDGPLQVSPAVPDLKIGSIQLLGAMVVDTAEQFEAAMRDDSAIERALRDTRYDVNETLGQLLARVAASLAPRA